MFFLMVIEFKEIEIFELGVWINLVNFFQEEFE